MALFYSFDAALLAGNLSSIFRKLANLQGLTVAATVLCAAPFGLIVTCLALAVRPWVLLPVFVVLFRSATNIPARTALLPCVHSLIGAVVMAGVLSLPIAHPAWVNGALGFLLQGIAGVVIYFTYLYFFASDQLRPRLSAVFTRFR